MSCGVGVDLRTAYPGHSNYNALPTQDIEQQSVCSSEEYEITQMSSWKKLCVFAVFIGGLSYGIGYTIYIIINHDKLSILDKFIIYVTIIMSFMGLSFGGYKFYMRNDIKEALTKIDKNADKRHKKDEMRHREDKLRDEMRHRETMEVLNKLVPIKIGKNKKREPVIKRRSL